MTEKRQRMISAMKYIVLAIIVGYLVILMLYASGSKRAFSEVSKALSSVLDSKELVQMDDQMLKRNYGLNSADYKGVLYYSSPSSISAAEVLVIQVKNDAQIENVTNAIAQRKAQRIEDFDSYLPEQFGLFFGGILVWIFSRKITKPVLELARLSEDMANLNFDAKYTSGGKNEIGVLGENFNKMSEQLEKTISELKTANNQLQHDIEQKEKLEDMRNEFLGNVSHELKTPIALIQGYAEGLKEGINDDPESTEFYCNVIIDEAGKMNRMVKNLLILNQLEFGSDEVEFERFDIVKLVKGVIASCDILIQQAEANIDFIAGESAYVWADEFKTEQVVRNYLTNAIHHAENEKRIEVKIIRTEGKVRVSVFNSGKPIPEEDIPKLWDKFYKVDKAHTREYGGNGIGLSIVKAIMESFHQGYGVKNYDNGVEFWFELDAKCGKV